MFTVLPNRTSTFEVGRSLSGVRCSGHKKTNDLSAEEIGARLKLKPHATYGFVRVTFISNQRIAPGELPAPFQQG
jgi:uncharacterized protein